MTQSTRTDEMTWRSSPVPVARAIENFSAAEVGDGEYVFLDTERLEYHTLNSSAFAVWQLCDGIHTSADIANALKRTPIRLPIEAVDLAISELGKVGLLEGSSASWNTRLNRRRVVKLAAAGLLGAAVVPAVSSITAPVGANLTTCTPDAGIANGGSCNCSTECASGCCKSNGAPSEQNRCVSSGPGDQCLSG